MLADTPKLVYILLGDQAWSDTCLEQSGNHSIAAGFTGPRPHPHSLQLEIKYRNMLADTP